MLPLLLIVFFGVGLYLQTESDTVQADSLAKPLAEHLPEGLQALQHALRRVHGAILITGERIIQFDM